MDFPQGQSKLSVTTGRPLIKLVSVKRGSTVSFLNYLPYHLLNVSVSNFGYSHYPNRSTLRSYSIVIYNCLPNSEYRSLFALYCTMMADNCLILNPSKWLFEVVPLKYEYFI